MHQSESCNASFALYLYLKWLGVVFGGPAGQIHNNEHSVLRVGNLVRVFVAGSQLFRWAVCQCLGERFDNLFSFYTEHSKCSQCRQVRNNFGWINDREWRLAPLIVKLGETE